MQSWSGPSSAKRGRVDLAGIIEAAEHDAIVRQIVLGAAGCRAVVRQRPGIARHETAGQTVTFSSKERNAGVGNNDAIGDDVVRQALASHRPREPQEVDDDRCRTRRKQRRPAVLRVPRKIDEDVDLGVFDRFEDRAVVPGLAIDEAMERPLQPNSQLAAVARTDRERVGFEPIGVVALENSCGQFMTENRISGVLAALPALTASSNRRTLSSQLLQLQTFILA